MSLSARPRSASEALVISDSNSSRPSLWSRPAAIIVMSSPIPMSRLRNRSRVRMTAVKPATSVPSRSKNAPILGPGGLAITSATEPGRRISRDRPELPLFSLMSRTPIRSWVARSRL